MAITSYPLLGIGEVFIGTSADALVSLGNNSELKLAITEETVSEPNHITGQGTFAEVRWIDKAEVSINPSDLKPANLALALFGANSTVAAGSAVSESHTATQGAMIRLAYSNPSSVVVKDETDTTTYDVGDDYTVGAAGITITAGSAISNDDVIHISYSYGAMEIIEAAVASGDEYYILFQGQNRANSGKMVHADLYKVRFGPAKEVSLLGKEFSSIGLTGTLLADTSRPNGTSQYFTIRVQE